MTEDQKTDWSKIAAWTFGVWAAVLPLSASIIGYYQRETIKRQDEIRDEIAALRLYVVGDSKTLHERQDRNTRTIDDHEQRLRHVENHEP